MGYDINRFRANDVNEEFICSICHDILENPVLVEKCQHIFCYDCIHKWLQKSTEKVCPNDRKAINDESLRSPDRPFCNLIKNLQITCDFSDGGCDARVNLDLLESHVSICEYNPKFLDDVVFCQSNCGAKLKRRQIKDHNCLDFLKQIIEEKNNKIIDLESQLSLLIHDEMECLKREIQQLKNENLNLKSESINNQKILNDNIEINKLLDFLMESNDNTIITDGTITNDITKKVKPSIIERETSVSNKSIVESLCLKGFLTDSRAKNVMLLIDKEYFEFSYDNDLISHPLSNVNAKTSGPSIHDAKLLEYLEPLLPYNSDHFNILNVGSGNGYLTSCITMMGEGNYTVIGIDSDTKLIESANKTVKTYFPALFECGILKFAIGDGKLGYPNDAPYDLILVQHCNRIVSPQLLSQLKSGGKIIIKAKELSI